MAPQTRTLNGMRIAPYLVGSVVLASAIGVPSASSAVLCSSTPALDQQVTCTASVSGQVITVPSGATSMTVTVKGAGGGGGGAEASAFGGMGGMGASVQATINVVGLTAIKVTVGAGGTGGIGPTSPESGSTGDSSEILLGCTPLAHAGGGGGGAPGTGGGTGGQGASGSGSSAHPTLASAVTINPSGGSAGGMGGSNSSGSSGSVGSVALKFSGPATPPASPAASAAPTVTHRFSWEGQGSGPSTSDLQAGTWQNTPTGSDWKLPGHVLLGWSTSPKLPVSLARGMTSAFDGIVDGQRIIFIPAGKPTFVTGDASLYAIWDVSTPKMLIGRC